MRIRTLLIAALLPAAAPVPAAEPSAAWGVSTFSTMGGQMAPGPFDPSRVRAGRIARVDGAGNLFVVGSQGDSGGCIVTLKYAASTGATLWRQEACAPRDTNAGALALDAAGDVIVTGAVGGDARVIKYAGATGAVLWDQRFGGDGFDMGRAIEAAPDGDAIVAVAMAGRGIDTVVMRLRAADGTAAWQRTLDGGADDVPGGLALDAAGNALVAITSRSARGDDDWWVAKLLAADGAIAWQRTLDSGASDTAAALAVDARGDALVAGIAADAMRTVKLAGADGAAAWSRSFERGSGATALALDAAGNAHVAGWAPDGAGGTVWRVAKLVSADGALAWQASSNGSRPGPAFARAIAVDAAGNVAATGITFAAGQANADFRTAKYAAGNGTELWSTAYRGGGFGRVDSGYAVATAGTATYAVGNVAEASRSPGIRAIRYGDPAAAATKSINVQGLWWRAPAGSESGWGINLTQQGEILFATWFTYAADGSPLWLVMSRGDRIGENAYAGTLYQTRGPAFNSLPFDPKATQSTAVGTARFTFTAEDAGVFDYTVNGSRGAKPITRHVYASPVPTCSTGTGTAAMPNYQDMWWAAPAGSESGWGVNVSHQGDVLFVTWFTYGADGKAQWLVGSNVAKSGNASYSGLLYRTAGPAFDAASWDPARVMAVPAGQATFTFRDAENGVFAYTLDGIAQSKPIVRQVYASPKTVCR